MSETSSELGSGGRKRTVAQLVDRLAQRTSAERLSLLSHLSIGSTLCKLRDAILAGEEVSRGAATSMLCAGIALYRRHTLGDREEEDEDSAETNALIKQSATFVFVLLAAIEGRSAESIDLDAVHNKVAAAGDATLRHVLRLPRRKRKAAEVEGEGEAEGEGEESEDAAAWARALTISSGELTMCVLRYVSCTIGQEKDKEHELLADVFFRNSAACMAHKLLLKNGAQDYVSLRSQATSDIPRHKRLLAIAQAGESEAGQSVLRDLLLSFLLPARIIGVRRHLLMSRAASTAAGVDYASEVNQAHSVAMAGCEFIWERGADELERACALLAGAAVLTTRGGQDPIRKQDAFLGRVSLPFFETTPPNPGVKRLALIPDQQRWVLYKIGKNNAPHVLCNLRGFEGLCDCLLEFL